MSNDTPKIDGPAVHRAAVAHAGELGTAAVAHAQTVKDALSLPDAPVSPNAPPPYPAPVESVVAQGDPSSQEPPPDGAPTT
jgi:hypothetical protein